MRRDPDSTVGGTGSTGLATVPQPTRSDAEPQVPRGLAVLFGVTAFLGAGLLFVVQPLVAKLLLPAYGGSATVWSTASLFFQVLLLLGYLYTHWSTSRLGPRRQPWWHLGVLVLPLLALPLALPADAAPDGGSSPVLWLLRTLALMVGLPFVVLATTGPLLQKWFSWTADHRADDPYFLFAASNLGSFGGLLAYPLLIEPTLSLQAQRQWWSLGCIAFVALTGACGMVARRHGDPDLAVTRPVPAAETTTVTSAQTRLEPRLVALWLGLAFLPSALMLAVTAHISTDVAAIPLLWVVPLAIYLATFVAAFARSNRKVPRTTTRAAAAIALVASLAAVVPGHLPLAVAVGLNLVLLTLVAFAAHGRLAATRPAASHLTHFYLVVAVGGAAGGLLNGVVAPLVFDRVLEYPLGLAVVPLLLLGTGVSVRSRLERRFPASLVTLAWVVLAVGVAIVFLEALSRDGVTGRDAVLLTVLAGGGLVGWLMARQPATLALVAAVLMVVPWLADSGTVMERSRTFFGSYTVENDGVQHRLVHGTTLHGTQWLDPARRDDPTTYFSKQGPLGDVLEGPIAGNLSNIGIIGLGAGTIAAYGQPGWHMTFYEIDGEMVRIASDPEYFTFLGDSRADVDTVVGDGRLKLAEAPSGSFDLIILDAFSSDSIPVHLLTREAMRMYADRLAPDGLVMAHISNRMFDLEPVLAAAADDLGWQAAFGRGGAGVPGSSESVWVALSPNQQTITTLLGHDEWRPVDRSTEVHWTDDYSSLIDVLL
jgi:hypothetical protein